MTFEFTMMDKTNIVDCTISSTAMDELTSSKATRPADREAQFLKFRELIERIASDLFDQRGKSQKPVRIFYHHTRHRREVGPG
jgi:Protein of unknown function (DUF1488)